MLRLVVVVLGVLLVCTSASQPRISDVSILLPPKMTHPVEYRLQGINGCFKWSWDHHDILSVLPGYNFDSRCSASAILKSIAPYSGRKETAVYATDVHSGMVIHSKVYIDNFSRIQIFCDSIKLDVDELATLRVRAFDSEENVFTSLVGVQFMWQLMPEPDGLPHHLVHVPFKVSPLSDCGGFCSDLYVQTRLEDSSVFSDLYVVKGTEFGREYVSVHLLEPTHDHIADKIVLTVAEAMSITPPSPVYVLIGAVVQYNLSVIRGSFPQAVSLPSSFHKWTVSNNSVSRVETWIGKAYALSLGVTTITVEDTRIPGHIQMSSLHVVRPNFLSLNILPLSLSGDLLEGVTSTPSISRWYVVSGRQYLIEMKVFAQGLVGAEEIYIRENDNIKLHEDDSYYWNMFPVSNRIAGKHEWWHSRILKATSYGLGNLTATVSYSNGHYERKEVIKVVQEVMVCDQVKFIMDRRSASGSILLLWAPAVYQEMELKATGGCATASWNYKWFSSNMTIASVSAYGIVLPKMPGRTVIRVVSIFDSSNYDEVVIEVSIPSSIVMLQDFPVETVVGSNLQASVTLTTSNGAYFYRCDSFSSSIRWKIEGESFTIIDTPTESFVLDEQQAQLLTDLVSGQIHALPTAMANGLTIRVSAVGVSDSGKAFGNSSSLRLRWEQRNCDGLAFWDGVDGLTSAKSDWERFLVLQNSSGLCCMVCATVVGFIDTSSHYPSESSESILTAVVLLQLESSESILTANACVTPIDLFGKAEAIEESTLEEETFVTIEDEEEKFNDMVFFYFGLFLVFLFVVSTIVVVVILCRLNTLAMFLQGRMD